MAGSDLLPHPTCPWPGGTESPCLCHTGTENGSPVASISHFVPIKRSFSSIVIWLDVESVVTQKCELRMPFW